MSGLIRLIAVFILSVIAFAGCATLPSKPNPQVEARLNEANAGLDALQGQLEQFYMDLNGTIQDISTLEARPGWSEMAEIIRATPLDETSEPDKKEDSDEYTEWSTRWSTDWREPFYKYLSLVDRCTILEARRIALQEKLMVIQAKYIAATTLDLAEGRYEEGKSIYSLVEALSKTEAELNSYFLNDIGLYNTGFGK